MELIITLKDIVQIVIFLFAAAGGIWKVSGILNKITNELQLIAATIKNFTTTQTDHESRIRVLEASKCKCEYCKSL